MDLQLTDKWALITGASAGIGASAAKLFAQEGVNLVLTGRRAEALDVLADEIIEAGGSPPVCVAGVLDNQEGCDAITAAALEAAGGTIDVLLNNAGASHPLDDIWDEEHWTKSYQLNFAAARQVTAALAPAMQAQNWGRIINITGAMVSPAPNAAMAAKAGLQSWSRSLSMQLAGHGITVNTVAPGRINSDQIRNNLYPTEESRKAFIDAYIPAGYFGEPEDLAILTVFLASPLARYINGAAIPVDGAMLRIG